MPPIGPSFFILGLLVASITADETSTFKWFSTSSKASDNPLVGTDSIPITVTPSITAHATTNVTSVSITTNGMNVTNSTIAPSATKRKGNTSSEDGQNPENVTPKMILPKPTGRTTTTKANKNSTTKPSLDTGDSTGIIILVVIIVVALAFGIICYFTRKRGRRYSVDFTSRHDEANIPLSTVEPVPPVDTVSQNGLQTFGRAENDEKEPEEPEEKPKVQEEQKAEADKSVVDPSAESAAPAPPPDSAEDKPKEDAVEQAPPAPVEPTVEEKTDDEGVVSSKTSVESLKESNENNSNNADFRLQTDLKSNSLFWDIPLDCPV